MIAMNSKYQPLANLMASEIVFSPNPGKTMRKWRELFNIAQTELSNYLGITSSTISDYESERRKNPGINIVKRFVYALIDIDLKRGGEIVNQYLNQPYGEEYYSLHEFAVALTGYDLVKIIEGKVVANADVLEHVRLYGYTLIRSLKAISEMKSSDFPKLFGNAHDRAFIFTEVSTGRSPMVVIRVNTTKPSLIVLHGLKEEKLDPLALQLAQREHIPLVLTDKPINEIIESLNKL